MERQADHEKAQEAAVKRMPPPPKSCNHRGNSGRKPSTGMARCACHFCVI